MGVGESLGVAGPMSSSARDGLEVFKLSKQLCHGDFIGRKPLPASTSRICHFSAKKAWRLVPFPKSHARPQRFLIDHQASPLPEVMFWFHGKKRWRGRQPAEVLARIIRAKHIDCAASSTVMPSCSHHAAIPGRTTYPRNARRR